MLAEEERWIQKEKSLAGSEAMKKGGSERSTKEKDDGEIVQQPDCWKYPKIIIAVYLIIYYFQNWGVELRV